MKVVILAGGLGTRISEETDIMPKPMVRIGDMPILWHIMKIYSESGFNEFVILLGYKGYVIKDFFVNYLLRRSDLTVDVTTGDVKIHSGPNETWKVTLVETGESSMTGARIWRAREYIGDERFFLTYGDGLANIDLISSLRFHNQHGKLLTMTSAQPEGRFGALQINSDAQVESFSEKPKGDGAWVNAGFFVCEPGIFSYLDNAEDTVFEKKPLENMAKDGEVFTYKHKGFWMPMDTLKDKNSLNLMVRSGKAPWITWKI